MFILTNTSSISNNFIAELRDAQIQQDSMRFRRNLERIGEIFAYEISKTLDFVETDFETPLGIASVPVIFVLKNGRNRHGIIGSPFDLIDVPRGG